MSDLKTAVLAEQKPAKDKTEGKAKQKPKVKPATKPLPGGKSKPAKPKSFDVTVRLSVPEGKKKPTQDEVKKLFQDRCDHNYAGVKVGKVSTKEVLPECPK
jgi:hypothetical protein